MDSSFAHWLLVCSDGIKLRLPSDGKTASILLWELRQELFNTKVLYKSMYTHVCVCVCVCDMEGYINCKHML